MNQIEDFEDYKIVEGSIQFKDKQAVAFGCIGTLDASSNTEEVVKKCEGKIIKKIKRITDMVVSVTGHVKIPVSRELVGLTNKGLKAGVYAFGTDTFSNSFVFTAKVLDMEGNAKYIAFTNMENVKGLSLKINNDTTEIEMSDMEFSALADDNNMFYYEAYESELTDDTVKEKWLTSFTPELVKETTE